MAIRKPKATPRRTKVREEDRVDISDLKVFVPTPEQVEWQLRELKELLDEWEREFGPITDEHREAVKRAWPESP